MDGAPLLGGRKLLVALAVAEPPRYAVRRPSRFRDVLVFRLHQLRKVQVDHKLRQAIHADAVKLRRAVGVNGVDDAHLPIVGHHPHALANVASRR